MKKNFFLLVALVYMYAIAGINTAYSCTIIKPKKTSGLWDYNKGSEFIKLSFKQFASLTGAKENFRNKLSFHIMRIKVKHDLRKNTDIKLTGYYKSKRMSVVMKILSWVIGILLILLLIFALIFSSQRR